MVKPIVYILGLASLSCSWAAVPSSIAYWIVAAAAALAFTTPGLDAPIPFRVAVPRPRISLGAVGLGLLASLPPLVVLLRTLGQEFPYLGDHDHHLFQTENAFRVLRVAFVPLCIGVAWLVRSPRRRTGVAIAALLFAASHLPTSSTVFATRYPGLDHFTTLPLNALGHLTGRPSPTNVLRIEHALIVPAWLFVLRPSLLGRQPDGFTLFAAFGFVWPGMAAYYFTTAYLEPPMLVMVALAVEASLRDGARGHRAALLYLGVGTLFKEQAVFALPLVAGAAWLMAQGREERRETVRVAVIAVVPVALYFLARRNANVWRGAALLPLDRLLDAERISRWAAGAWRELGPTLLGLTAATAVAAAGIRRRSGLMLAAWAGVVLAENAFFYVDSYSEPWTGYSRFFLVPATVAALVAATEVARLPARARGVLSIFAAIAALPTLVPLLSKTSADAKRNFFEHVDAPLFLPIRHGAELLPRGTRRVRVVSTVGLLFPKYSLYALDAAYPDLARGVSFERPRPGQFDEHDCACKPGDLPRLALFVVFTNRGATHPLRASIEAAQARCEARLEATCTTARRIEAFGDATWGVVGIP